MKISRSISLLFICIILYGIIITKVSCVHFKNSKHTKTFLQKNGHSNSVAEPFLTNQMFIEHGTRQNTLAKISGKEALSNIPVIAYYFASTSCPACHNFTPYLKSLYEDWNKSPQLIEIIWIQVGDCTQQQWEEFYSQMPWLAIPRNDPRTFFLEQKMSLDSVPELVIVSKEGEVLEREGYRDVEEFGSSSIAKWLDISLKSL